MKNYLAAICQMDSQNDKTEKVKVKVPGFAPQMSAVLVEYECRPQLGGSNQEIYGGLLEMSEEEMNALKEKKVI